MFVYTKPTSQGKFEGHEVTRQGEGRASVPESAFDVGLVRAMASRWDEGTAREWGGGRRAPGTRDPPPEDGGGLVPPEAVAAANLALAPVLQELESGDSLAATRAHAMAESNYEEAAAVAAAAAVCSPASPEADSSPSKESIEADSGVAPAGPRHRNEAGSFHSMSSGGEVEHEMEVLEHEMEVLSRLANIVDSGTRQRWTVCTSTTYTPPGTLVPAEDMQQNQDSLVGTLEDMQQMFEAPTSPPDEAQPLESATRLTPAEADLGSSVDTSGNGSGSWTLEEKQAVAEPTSQPDESQPVESATCLAPAGPAARGIGLDETSPAPPPGIHTLADMITGYAPRILESDANMALFKITSTGIGIDETKAAPPPTPLELATLEEKPPPLPAPPPKPLELAARLPGPPPTKAAPPPLPAPTSAAAASSTDQAAAAAVVNIGGQRPWPSFDAAATRQHLSSSLCAINPGRRSLEPSGAAGSSGLPMQARVSAWASDAGGGGGNRLAPAGDQRGNWWNRAAMQAALEETGLPSSMAAELSWSLARETLWSHERGWRRAEDWWGSRRDDDWWNSGEWWSSQRADDWWNSDGTTSDQRGRG